MYSTGKKVLWTLLTHTTGTHRKTFDLIYKLIIILLNLHIPIIHF